MIQAIQKQKLKGFKEEKDGSPGGFLVFLGSLCPQNRPTQTQTYFLPDLWREKHTRTQQTPEITYTSTYVARDPDTV